MVTVLCLGLEASFCTSIFREDEVLKAADALAGLTQQNEASLLVAPSAALVKSAIEEAVRCGANEALIEFALPWEAELAGVRLDELVKLRCRLLEACLDARRYTGTKLRAKVTRRDVVLRPYALWVPVPLPRADPQLCSSYPSCSSCLLWCPTGALEGKPPKADPSKCLGCGLCVSGCPFGSLEHGYSSGRLYDELCSWLAEKGVGTLVVSCVRGLESMERELQSWQGRALVHHAGCVAGFNLFVALQLASSGVGVLLYCPESLRRDCERSPCVGLLGRAISELERLYERLPLRLGGSLAEAPVGRGLKGAPTLNAVAALRAAAPHAKDSSEAVSLNLLPLAIVEVSAEACTLCSACAKACPTLALREVEEGEEVKLVFSASRCLACGSCEASCPEGALRVVRKSVPALLREPDRYEVLASSRIARCRSCGAPLGPDKLVRKVEERLRSQGAPPHVVESVWYCSRCKLLRRW